jgi:hypothetical protein
MALRPEKSRLLKTDQTETSFNCLRFLESMVSRVFSERDYGKRFCGLSQTVGIVLVSAVQPEQ